jgi:hypothetical protein
LNTLQTLAAIAVVVVVLGVSVLVAIGTNGSSETSSLPRQTATTGADGLRLTLSLNTTDLTQGESIGIDVTLSNTLASTYNVSVSSLWPFQAQTQACGNQIYPFGVAVFRGRYSAGNVSEGTPLNIFAPIACPQSVRFISGYFFQPNSDSAMVLPGTGQSIPMSANVTVGRTYTSESQSQGLTPGVYTVAAADEWGLAVFLYVEVQ